MTDPPPIRIDVLAHQVRCGDQVIAVSRMEWDLLLYLARHQGIVVPYRHLLRDVWHDEAGLSRRSLITRISDLRRKLGAHIIGSVIGVGYSMPSGTATVADPADEPAPPTLAGLVDWLRATVGDLAAHIEQRATELAAPRIAEIREQADRRVTGLERVHADDRQRWAYLEDELRRQIDTLEQKLEHGKKII